jgi:intein/homing endonuclease
MSITNLLHYDSIIRVWRNDQFENIKIGDFVESFIIEEPQNDEIEKNIAPFYEINAIDFKNLRLRKTYIIGIQKKKNPTGFIYEIQVNQSIIRVTPGHIFKVRTKDPRNKDLEYIDLRADQLIRGKHLLFEMSRDRPPDDCWQEIKKIVKVPSKKWVYDIQLQDFHFFFANGIGISD